jgi:phage N-6-adenine-methyltransferase
METVIKETFIQDRSAAVAHSRRVMTSSKDLTWATPQAWFDYLDLEFDFTLDPCCTHETAKCSKHFTPAENGLTQSWEEETVFMNPPYGKEVGLWMKKAYEEARDNLALVVCFVRASVDTEWWRRYAARATEIRFPKGRVTFAGAETAAPFPVAIVIFRPRL